MKYLFFIYTQFLFMGQMRHSPPAKSHFRLYIDILCLNYVTVWYKHRRKISIKTKQYTVYHPEATATNAKATIQKKNTEAKANSFRGWVWARWTIGVSLVRFGDKSLSPNKYQYVALYQNWGGAAKEAGRNTHWTRHTDTPDEAINDGSVKEASDTGRQPTTQWKCN